LTKTEKGWSRTRQGYALGHDHSPHLHPHQETTMQNDLVLAAAYRVHVERMGAGPASRAANAVHEFKTRCL